MSRHRAIRTLDLDDEIDDFYGGGEDGGEDELSSTDKERLREGLVQVRQTIGCDIPEITDTAIEETLWYYYFDVEKSVNYLIEKHTPKAPKSPKAKKGKKSAANSPNANIASCWWLRTCVWALCASPFTITYPTKTAPHSLFSATDFFLDSPWLNIPPSRKGEILVESLYPPGGLKGGSSSSSGMATPNASGVKLSKLAALAAARKKQAGQSTPMVEGGEPTKTKSADLLTRLGQKSKNLSKVDTYLKDPDRLQDDVAVNAFAAGRYPTRRRKSSERQVPDQVIQVKPAASGPVLRAKELKSKDILANPSVFAMAIFGSRINEHSPALDIAPGAMFTVPYYTKGDHTDWKAFQGPSPDDVVASAQQKSAKGTKMANGKSKQTSADSTLTKSQEGLNSSSTASSPARSKSKNLDVLQEYGLRTSKNDANFVVIGHVDAGKSTLMGRLLLDLKVVDERTIEKFRREAEKIGKSSFALAWVLDQTNEERSRGVTIDIARNKFETAKTQFTILDAPGHRDFIPNMIAGASQADFAVLVVDASTGSFESGLRGQTKEHALLVRSIGVQQIIVAVNKLDMVGWSQDRFEEIQQQTLAFLTAAGFQAKNLSFIPCSGLTGDNIVRKPAKDVIPWYNGTTLVQQLDSSEPIKRALEKPLRMTIDDIFKGGLQNPLSVSGRIEAGSLQVGESIMAMPSGEKAHIKGLEVDQESRGWAVAGQNVVLHLSDIDEANLKSGDVFCSVANPMKNISTFIAKVLAFDHITPMYVDIHRGRLHIAGRISALVATVDKGSGAVLKKKPRLVAPGSLARVKIELDQAVPLEAPTRVILRAGGETIAAGLLE